ncbi:MAG TPA: hypothetical protein VNG51_00970 [Ktedonobacteraceae bacterium]|nr:hypothetical protein [Ktedonobacteraceae bacterium]
MSLPFYSYLFQFLTLPELYIWSILTGWTAILLILSAIAFFFLRIPHARNAWWRYLVLLLIGGIGLWSFMVAYNGYQQWLNFNAQLPLHGVFLGLKLIRTPYLAAIQTCQLQFALTAGVLVLLIGVAGWQFLCVFTKKTSQARQADNRHVHLLTSYTLFVTGLCCLTLGVLLITKLYLSLIYAPQMLPFPFDEPTTLELIGLYIVSLGGPLILLLLSVTSYVEERSLSRR